MTKMEISTESLNAAIRDLNNTFYMSPYDGFQVAWDVILKLAGLIPQNTEPDRMGTLLKIIPEAKARDILSDSAVDELLNVRPRLEILLSNQHKRINDAASNEVTEFMRLRTIDPGAALVILTVILKRIRDHRVHGFETKEGSQDEVIFRASLRLLYKLGGSAVDCLRADQEYKIQE